MENLNTWILLAALSIGAAVLFVLFDIWRRDKGYVIDIPFLKNLAPSRLLAPRSKYVRGQEVEKYEGIVKFGEEGLFKRNEIRAMQSRYRKYKDTVHVVPQRGYEFTTPITKTETDVLRKKDIHRHVVEFRNKEGIPIHEPGLATINQFYDAMDRLTIEEMKNKRKR